MPQSNSFEVQERRSAILRLNSEGLTPSDIGKRLKVSTAQVYFDLRAIKKRGIKQVRDLKDNGELTFLYNNAMSNLIHVNKELWELKGKEDILDSDKIKVLKGISDNTMNIIKLVSDQMNIYVVNDLAEKVNNLQSLIMNPETKSKGFMNLDLPKLKSIDNKTILIDK